jgi:hypothetical protein
MEYSFSITAVDSGAKHDHCKILWTLLLYFLEHFIIQSVGEIFSTPVTNVLKATARKKSAANVLITITHYQRKNHVIIHIIYTTCIGLFIRR